MGKFSVESDEFRPRSGAGSRARRAATLGALVLSAVLSPGFGFAQVTAADESTSTAAALFQRGKVAATAKDWLLAFSLFDRSFRMLPSYDTAANLGQAALKLERYADAADFLTYSVEHFPPSGDAERGAAIQALLEIALAQVGVVEVSSEPADAELLLDDERTKTINPNRWYLSPGTHVISARAKGFGDARREIAVRPRMNYRVDLALSPVEPTTKVRPEASVDQPPVSDWRDTIPIVLVGGGLTVASLGLGIGFQLLADSKESQSKAALGELGSSDPSACTSSAAELDKCSRVDQLAKEADDRRLVSYVGFGVASAALLATAALILWPLSSDQSVLVPTLVIDVDMLGLVAEGRF